MDIIWDYLRDLQDGTSPYAIAIFLILIWWMGRGFVRLYHQASGGSNRIERPVDQDRPRRRLPLN
jgi:hypothetical protein